MSNGKFFLLIFFALALVAIGHLQEPDTDDELQTIRQSSADPQWIAITKDVMTEFMRQTTEIRSWSINAPDQNAAIIIYIFDSERIRGSGLNTFRNNCRYLGDGRQIVCDVSLFRNLVSRYDLDKREEVETDTNGHIVRRYVVANDESTTIEQYKLMMTWVLGHELGHLVHKHQGQVYFQQHTFDKAIPAESYCHKIELEADAFLVSVFPAQNGGFKDLYLFVYELVNREIRRRVCPGQPLVAYCDKIFPGTGLAITGKPVGYTADDSHPDYIVRLLRILDIIQEREDFGLLAYQARQLIESGLVKLPSPEKYKQSCNIN